jgi:hypothetical protein
MAVKITQGLVGKSLEPVTTATPSVAEQAKVASAAAATQAVTVPTSAVNTDAAVVSLRYSVVSQSSSRGERLTLEKAERVASDVAEQIRSDEDGTRAHKTETVNAKSTLT